MNYEWLTSEQVNSLGSDSYKVVLVKDTLRFASQIVSGNSGLNHGQIAHGVPKEDIGGAGSINVVKANKDPKNWYWYVVGRYSTTLAVIMEDVIIEQLEKELSVPLKGNPWF